MAVVASISPQRLAELHAAGDVEVIDVRTQAEYGEVHIPMARNVPLDTLDAEQLRSQRNGNAAAPLYVICRSGNRSARGCEKLAAAGLPDVVNVEGGTQAWIGAGLPVVRGKKTISLERQVRIATGGIVLVAAVLSMTVHPYLAGLAALAGAGVMVAGVFDACGMAMILGRMPWNRAGAKRKDEAVPCSR